MKLTKDNVIRVLTDEETIKIFKENGWVEVPELKVEKPEVKIASKKGDK